MDVRLPEPHPMADYLFTSYFLNEVLRKRPYIKPEWCVFVIGGKSGTGANSNPYGGITRSTHRSRALFPNPGST